METEANLNKWLYLWARIIESSCMVATQYSFEDLSEYIFVRTYTETESIQTTRVKSLTASFFFFETQFDFWWRSIMLILFCPFQLIYVILISLIMLIWKRSIVVAINWTVEHELTFQRPNIILHFTYMYVLIESIGGVIYDTMLIVPYVHIMVLLNKTLFS